MKTVAQSTYKTRQLRKLQTIPERRLWQILRGKNINNIKFRRQQSIGKYIVDFVSYEKMLVVELDGGQHNAKEQQDYDTIRTRYLESLDYTVLRFWNNDVMNNFEGVVQRIKEWVEKR